MDAIKSQTFAVREWVLNLGQFELEEAVEELDAAIESQEQWYADLNRTLVCDLPPNLRDLSKHSHHLCPFGAWLDVYGNEQIRQLKDFAKIAADHKKLHILARNLLIRSMQNEQIEVKKYESLYRIEKRLIHRLHDFVEMLREKVSNIDSLTGVYNRKEMDTRLVQQQDLVNRNVYSVSIALMDIDNFKMLNDLYGHLVGDKVLQAIGAYLQQALRSYDNVFRFGGDEFLIVMPDTDLHQAHEILFRIHSSMSQLGVTDERLNNITVTTSFGISQMLPGHDINDAVRSADKAMLRAKSSGRNRLAVGEIH
jgi:diguanylate cyclase